IDGQGLYGITQTCPDQRVLRDSAGGETVTLQGLTHFNGGHGHGHGGGLRNDGPVNVVSSDVGPNQAVADICEQSTANNGAGDVTAQDNCEDGDGGGIYAGAVDAAIVGPGYAVSVTSSSSIHDNIAADDGGGVYTWDTLTVTNSQFDANTAQGQAAAGGRGGGAYASDGVTVTNGSFTGNNAMCGVFDGVQCTADSDGGGFHTYGAATITGSTLTANHAYDSGGGFWAEDGATVDVSTFTGNNAGGTSATASAADQLPGALNDHVSATDSQTGSQSCNCIGGGFAVDLGSAQVTGSTFVANGATCDTNCIAGGGGFFANNGATVSGSTFGDPSDPPSGSNVAGCVFECFALGGGLLSGGDVNVDTSTFELNFVGCVAFCGGLGGGFFAGEAFPLLTEVSGLAQKLPAGVKALATGGTLNVDQTTFSANQTSCAGPCAGSGGGFAAGGPSTADLTASTFTANDALYDGGAFSVNGGVGGLALCANAGCGGSAVSLTNSTVTGNRSGFSAAISVPQTNDSLRLVNDTIDSNTIVERTFNRGASAPSDPHAAVCMCLAANVFAGNLTSFGTVVTHPRFEAATPTATAAAVVENCWVDTTTSEGYNFSDDDSCGLTDPTDDVATGNDPSLGALADNGGPTQTMLPLVGSPLLDAIPPASCLVDVDQRGVTRPQGTGCDIGAVEVEVIAPTPTPTPSPGPSQLPDAVLIRPRFTG
ncbi:MAG: hypothetical protein QOF40_1229, partial [Actinomycetota bacterium]|nr:hypothetical protein [Actinomycetota bacterium]